MSDSARVGAIACSTRFATRFRPTARRCPARICSMNSARCPRRARCRFATTARGFCGDFCASMKKSSAGRVSWSRATPAAKASMCFAPRLARSWPTMAPRTRRSEEHTSELQSRPHLVCRLLLEKKKVVQETFIGSDDRAWLVRYCARLAGEADLAEDLAQETLLEACRNLHKIYALAGLWPWLAA